MEGKGQSAGKTKQALGINARSVLSPGSLSLLQCLSQHDAAAAAATVLGVRAPPSAFIILDHQQGDGAQNVCTERNVEQQEHTAARACESKRVGQHEDVHQIRA
jgi:hypothetical protein